MQLWQRAQSMGARSTRVEWLERGLPATMAAATSGMDAGLSSLHKRADTPKYWAIMAKPRREYGAWDDGGFDEQVLVWSAARETPAATRTGNYVENLPGINYYCELGVVINRLSSVVNRPQAQRMQRQYALDAHYSPQTPRDYRAKWKMLGAISRPPEGTYNGQDVLDASGASGERLIPYVYAGHTKTKQIFSTNVRPGDRLYVQCTKIRNPYQEFYMPNGAVSSSRSGTAGESLLQVRGFSSSDMQYTPVDTAGGLGHDPLDNDTNYTEFRAKAAAIAQRVDWDDDADTFVLRNVAAEEGFQESLEYLTQVEYEALREGSTEYLGLAIETENGRAPTQHELNLAHRSPAAMLSMQTVKYMLTLKSSTYN